MEADSHLGMANRIAAPLAKRVTLAFPLAGRQGGRYLVTGRPVGRSVLDATKTTGRRAFGILQSATVVLVVGGSQGARTLNEAAVGAFGDAPMEVIHVAGPGQVEETRRLLGDREDERYRLVGWLDNLPEAIAAADLVISRSGGSVFELAAIGRPSILVPYPHATADHQAKNAQVAVGRRRRRRRPRRRHERRDPARPGRGAPLRPAPPRGDGRGRPRRRASRRGRPGGRRGARAGARRPRPGPAAAAHPAPPVAVAALGGPRPIHMVGIGGAGMSGLARLARAAGYAVGGTDREESATLAALRAEGVDARAGHAAAAVAPDAEAVVVSTAIAPDNPELAEARRRGLPVIHRSELLAELMAGRRGLAVAGAHGKSTTSAMLLSALGDASACVGATVEGGGGTGAVWGDGPWFVAEADESDRSLLNLAPRGARSCSTSTTTTTPPTRRWPRSRRCSGRSWPRCPPTGCSWSAPTRAPGRAPRRRPARCALVGDVPGAFARVERTPGRPGFDLVLPGGIREPVPLRLAGEHNATNAACALALAEWCGVPLARAAARLEGFSGVGRRMEPRGAAGGVDVVDDYAHHPAEIRATLAGGARARPGPGGGGVPAAPAVAHPRARARAGRGARRRRRRDRHRGLPGPGAGRPRRERPRRGRRRAAARPWPCSRRTLADAADAAVAEARPGDLLITMGAGDVTGLGQELVRRLGRSTGDAGPGTAPPRPDIATDAPLAPLTTIRVGGTADHLARVASFAGVVGGPRLGARTGACRWPWWAAART